MKTFNRGALAVAVLAATSAVASASTISQFISSGGTITGATITGVLDQNATYAGEYSYVIQDATGGILMYGVSGYTPQVGDVVDVTGSYAPYNGNPEISYASSPSVTKTTGTAFTPPVVTTADFNSGFYNGVPLAGCIVTLKDLTFSGGGNFDTYGTFYGSDAVGSAALYFYYKDSYVVAAAGQAIPTVPSDVTGLVDYYNGTYEIYPVSITPSVTTVATPEPASLSIAGIGAAAVLIRRRRSH